MKADRVVLDTNVYVTLILSKRLNELVEWSKDHKASIYVCPELIDELTAVLKRQKIKKHLTEPVAAYIRFINQITEPVIIDRRFDRAPDIKDNYLFDLAYTVKSHYIVTNDHPLLNMKQVNRIKLIMLKDWKKLIEQATL
jgi:putative PIN family toxin of toxin-antitoxin system